VGIVPTAFTFDPPEEFAWETSRLEWLPYEQIQTMIQEQSSTFHKGLLQLFLESKSLIEEYAT